jgi:hypothetical protein
MTTITLYHDVYETKNGDGFYPSLDHGLTFKEINVKFIQENNIWKQELESYIPIINGFDGDQGEKILEELNKNSKIKGIMIWNHFAQIYPKVNVSKINISKKIK